MAWMPFVGVVYTAVVQAIVLGIAILRDTGESPVFPRWVGYFSMFCGMMFCPSSLLIFFKSGAFAWNGIASFWIVVVGYVAWTIVLSVLMITTSRRLEREDRATERPELVALRKIEMLTAEMAALRSGPQTAPSTGAAQ